MAQLIDKYREHPGALLKDRFLDPFRLTTQAVSRAASIDEVLLRQIIEGSQDIDPDTGLKLANYFGLSDDYFFRIKRAKDLS
ncbi:MAG: HigA family addiction module antitoxin [Desulfocapsaceae bacterium]